MGTPTLHFEKHPEEQSTCNLTLMLSKRAVLKPHTSVLIVACEMCLNHNYTFSLIHCCSYYQELIKIGNLSLNGVWRPLLTSCNKCIKRVSLPLIHDRSAGGWRKPEVNNKVLYMDATAEAWHISNNTNLLHVNTLTIIYISALPTVIEANGSRP